MKGQRRAVFCNARRNGKGWLDGRVVARRREAEGGTGGREGGRSGMTRGSWEESREEEADRVKKSMTVQTGWGDEGS